MAHMRDSSVSNELASAPKKRPISLGHHAGSNHFEPSSKSGSWKKGKVALPAKIGGHKFDTSYETKHDGHKEKDPKRLAQRMKQIQYGKVCVTSSMILVPDKQDTVPTSCNKHKPSSLYNIP